MSKLNDLLSQLFAKGYDGKTAPAGTTLADEMVDHVSGGVSEPRRRGLPLHNATLALGAGYVSP